MRRELNKHPRRQRRGISLTIPGAIYIDGTWKSGIDCQRLKAKMRDSGAYDSDYSNVPDGEYYYSSDYLRVCTLGTKDLPGFYKIIG